MFDWEPAFCHLVVSRHCTALCCAIACDMQKSALPTQYFLKQDSCPDAVGKNLECLLFTVLGKASFVGSHPLRKIFASLSWWEGLVVALEIISVQRLSGEEIHNPWQRLTQGGGLRRERGWSPQSACEPCKSSATSLPCKMKTFPLPAKKCHVAAHWHPPIFSCKSSDEFSSFSLCWSKALGLLCHEHEMVPVDWSQNVQVLNLYPSAQ